MANLKSVNPDDKEKKVKFLHISELTFFLNHCFTSSSSKCDKDKRCVFAKKKQRRKRILTRHQPIFLTFSCPKPNDKEHLGHLK